MASKVCAYVMTHDSGLAPNPFHGCCTLAVCTPNHMRANLDNGDWIIGVAGAGIREKLGGKDKWRIIYAMKISKHLPLKEYYSNREFKEKIPNKTGTPKQMCGDNFYKMSSGKLVHTDETNEHVDNVEQDTKEGIRVFVSNEFWYFGGKARQFEIDTGWGKKLFDKFTRMPRNIWYAYWEGDVNDTRWSCDEFNEFKEWLHRNDKNKPLPNPIHFGDWESKQAGKSTCRS